MSSVVWAGISVDPRRERSVNSQLINKRIDDALDAMSPHRLSVVIGNDGTELYRFLVGDVIVTDVRDRLGNRVGIGIQAGDDDHAFELLDDAYEVLSNALGIIDKHDDVDVWLWDRAATPPQLPQIVV